MTKRTFPLKSSREIELPRRISLDSEVVEISRFLRRGVSDDTCKVRRCHMAPQKSDTWQSHVVHLNEWLTISHVWKGIPWLTMSHLSA